MQIDTFLSVSFFVQSQAEKEKLETLGYLNTQKNDDVNDGISNEQDNCADKPKGPLKGMCTSGYNGQSCISTNQCGIDRFCSMDQEGYNNDGIGDLCDFYEGNGANDTDEDGMCEKDDNCTTFLTQPTGQKVVMVLTIHACLPLWKISG